MMLGLGVGIDYALFILSRHRQNLDDGMTVPEAIGQANSTAGLSVLFAGVTVIVAIAGLQVSGVPMMTVMGWASALMVLITMLAAITLLPAILGIVKTQGQRAQDPVHQAASCQRSQLGLGSLGRQGRRAPGSLRSRRRRDPRSARRSRCSRCDSASRTPATTRRRPRPARRTTSWPTPTAPASTVRSRSSSRRTAQPTPTQLSPRGRQGARLAKGVASVDAAGVQRGQGPRDHRRHADERTPGRRDVGHAAPSARHRAARRDR